MKGASSSDADYETSCKGRGEATATPEANIQQTFRTNLEAVSQSAHVGINEVRYQIGRAHV